MLAALLLSFCASDSLSAPLASQGHWDWLPKDFDILMRTSGRVNFSANVAGDARAQDLPPGYRSDFHLWVDFFRWKGLTSNWLIGNTTVISRNDSTAFQLSRIRYILTPGYRYEFTDWQISGLLLHECVHTVSRPEAEGAVWWNSVQIGAGSKGAYHDHFVEQYRKDKGFSAVRLDGRLDFGQFLYGPQSVWIGQNHDFRQELFGLARLRLGSFGPLGFFEDVAPHFWRRANGEIVQKWELSSHIYLLGTHNIAGGFVRWIPLDQNPIDNEENLVQVGVDIVF